MCRHDKTHKFNKSTQFVRANFILRVVTNFCTGNKSSMIKDFIYLPLKDFICLPQWNKKECVLTLIGLLCTQIRKENFMLYHKNFKELGARVIKCLPQFAFPFKKITQTINTTFKYLQNITQIIVNCHIDFCKESINITPSQVNPSSSIDFRLNF